MKKIIKKVLVIIFFTISFLIFQSNIHAITTGVVSSFPTSYSKVVLGGKGGTTIFGTKNGMNKKYVESGPWAICTRWHRPNKDNVAKKCDIIKSGWSKNDAMASGVANIILQASKGIDRDLNENRYYYSEAAINSFLYSHRKNVSEYKIFGKDIESEISILNKPYTLSSNTKSTVNNWKAIGTDAYNSTKNFSPEIKINSSSCNSSTGLCEVQFTIVNNSSVEGKGDKWATYDYNCEDSNITFISTNGNNKTSSIRGKKCTLNGKSGKITFGIEDELGNDSKWKIGFSVNVTRNFYVAQNYSCGKDNQTITTNQLAIHNIHKTAKGSATVGVKTSKTGATITYETIDCKLRLNKISTSGEQLLGAKFKYPVGDEEVELDLDNDNCISWAETGSFSRTITESNTPIGYKTISPFTLTKTLTESEQIENVENAPDTSIIVKKRDPKGNRVGGAVLAIAASSESDDDSVAHQKFVYLDTNGNIVANPVPVNGVALAKIIYDSNSTISNTHTEWTTSKDYDLKFVEIPYKKAINFIEVSVPDGYVNDPDDVVHDGFSDPSASPDSRNGSVEMINYKSEVSISKQDITTKKELPGAKMELFQKSQSGDVVIETWTSTTTPHIITNLVNGEYYIRETSAPKGYELNTEVYSFTIENGDVEGTTVVYNTPSKVTVADTLLSKKIITYVLGSMLIIAGAGVLFYEIKKKKHS